MGQINQQKVAKIAKLAKSHQNGKYANRSPAPCSEAWRSIILIFLNARREKCILATSMYKNTEKNTENFFVFFSVFLYMVVFKHEIHATY